MDLKDIVDDELVQPLRGAIVAEDMVATRRLIDSLEIQETKTESTEEVRVYAESYILELRDGEQYKKPPNIEDIKIWLEAKGLDSVLDPYAVLANILAEGTSWDKQGGSQKLQSVLNEQNISRIMDIAVAETASKIKSTKWLLQ